MAHPHRRLQAPFPLTVVLAELTVTVAVGMDLAVLDPQQAQRHALAPQFGVQPGPVRLRDRPPGGTGGGEKQALIQHLLRQVGRQRPGQSRRLGTLDVVTDGTGRDATTGRDGAVGELVLPLQAQDFVDFAHG